MRLSAGFISSQNALAVCILLSATACLGSNVGSDALLRAIPVIGIETARYGEFIENSNPDRASSAPSPPIEDDCPAGQHAPILRTTILTSNQFTFTPEANSSPDEPKSTYYTLTLPLASVSPVLPFINNEAGALSHGVLSTPRFLEDWAAYTAAAEERGPGVFPRLAVACAVHAGAYPGIKSVQALLDDDMAPFADSAPNALMAWGTNRAAVVDIYSLQINKEVGTATMRVRWQPRPELTPESSGCHSHQDMDHAHYHHLLAGGIDFVTSAEELPMTMGESQQPQQQPLTMFFKLGSDHPCQLNGKYRLVSLGRDKCTKGPPKQYIVYSGGSKAGCTNNGLFLRNVGTVKKERTLWAIKTSEHGETAVQATGRECEKIKGPNKKPLNVATRMGASLKRESRVVTMTGRNVKWVIYPNDLNCTSFTLYDEERAIKGYTAYLTASEKCSDTSLYVRGTNDGGPGNLRQKFRVEYVSGPRINYNVKQLAQRSGQKTD